MATTLEDLNVLQRAEKISDLLWKHVIRWDPFARDSVGLQIVKAADAIGASIAEVHGRFHYDEKIQFLYYARGSIFETKYWLNRTQTRGLLLDSTARDLSAELTIAAKQLNALMRDLKNRSNSETNQPDVIRDSGLDYRLNDFDSEPLFSSLELDWFSSIEQEALISNPEADSE